MVLVLQRPDAGRGSDILFELMCLNRRSRKVGAPDTSALWPRVSVVVLESGSDDGALRLPCSFVLAELLTDTG